MIDIHSHILFGTDDGSSSIEESIVMAKEAADAGFKAIIATPHYLEPQFTKTVSQNTDTINELKQALKSNDIPIDLYLGNEIYITHSIEDLINQEKVKALASSDYILFELPLFQKLDGAADIIRNLPYDHLILAHPERYYLVQKDIHYLDEFIEMGVLMQCNYESILGKYGIAAKHTMKKMLKRHMVDLLATDVHRMNSTYTRMGQIEQRFLKIIKEASYEYLTYDKPKNTLGIE